MFYVHQDYPRCVYHATAPARIVANQAEHAALPPGWYDSPGEASAAAAIPAAPPAPPAPPAPAAPAAPPAPAAPAAPATPVAPVEPMAPLTGPTVDAEQLARDASDAKDLHSTKVATILEKITNAPEAILLRVQALEATNPDGARPTLMKAIEGLLAAKAKA